MSNQTAVSIGLDLYTVECEIWTGDVVSVVSPSGEIVATFPLVSGATPYGPEAMTARQLAILVAGALNRVSMD